MDLFSRSESGPDFQGQDLADSIMVWPTQLGPGRLTCGLGQPSVDLANPALIWPTQLQLAIIAILTFIMQNAYCLL